MKKVLTLLKKSLLVKILLTLLALIGIGSFVFWMEGKPLAPYAIVHKILNPHSIDFVDDIGSHWWAMLISLGLTLNIIFMFSVKWFITSLNNGTLRWGGKAAND